MNGRRLRWPLFGPVIGAAVLAGCSQKMVSQPRYDPLEPSRFFPDGQSARQPVPGTIARDATPPDRHLTTSRSAAALADQPPSLDRPADYETTFPFSVTAAVMQQGRAQFQIYCVPCHGRAGTGTGTVVAAGYPKAESFHGEKIWQAPAGYLVDVVSRGHGSMPSYAAQIPPADRWAIIAYVRALQFSRHAPVSELPPGVREHLPGR